MGFPTTILRALLHPVSAEMKDLLSRRWQELPDHLQTDRQVLGRQLVHCGYTLGASYCALGCTHCYLPSNANRAPLPSLEEMKEQIDANRRLLGASGGLQITGGDVVDAYWKKGRANELVEIVAYATAAGVVPMLMTHGQVLLENPHYLDRLVVEGGLRKLAVHIDTTQAGRPGFPYQDLREEADLHPLRNAFVDLLLGARRRTGVSFHGALTVTATSHNQASIDQILRWLLADPRHLDAFRMISFQTEASVGRTKTVTDPVRPADVWAKISSAIGIAPRRDNVLIGHPDCSNMTTLLVLFPEGRVIDLMPSDPESQAFAASFLRTFERIGSGDDSLGWLRRLALVARRPKFLADAARYAYRRFREEKLSPITIAHKLRRGEARYLSVVLHNFMDSASVIEPRSTEVDHRLAACSFRGAVRRGDHWDAVPMCLVNAGERETLYKRQIIEKQT